MPLEPSVSLPQWEVDSGAGDVIREMRFGPPISLYLINLSFTLGLDEIPLGKSTEKIRSF